MWANLLFVNQLLPFGGCMLYTWSLAIQVHVYLVLPLVWNFGGVKGLVRTCVAGLVVAAALRVFAQLQLRDVLPKTDELTYFGFFWYGVSTRVDLLTLLNCDTPACCSQVLLYTHSCRAHLLRHPSGIRCRQAQHPGMAKATQCLGVGWMGGIWGCHAMRARTKLPQDNGEPGE